MTSHPFLEAASDGTLLRVKVQPRASQTAIGEPAGDFLKVRVTAPPVDHAANEAVLELLADRLGLRRGAVRLLRGATSRQKVVQITGLTPEQVLSRLGTA